MNRVIDSIWGNSFDGTLCGIVIVENDMGKRRAFFGSKEHPTTENGDAEYIAKCGNELTASGLMRLVAILEDAE